MALISCRELARAASEMASDSSRITTIYIEPRRQGSTPKSPFRVTTPTRRQHYFFRGMKDVLLVVALWMAFGVSHVGLTTRAVREPLVSRLGAPGFAWLFSAVSWVFFAILVAGYSCVQFAGPSGLAVASAGWARATLYTAIVMGFVLMAGTLAPSGYLDSPAAILSRGVRPAYGLERISRHPFFAGLILVTGSHALLAARLTGTLFFAGFVLLAVFGSIHQAKKLRARKGEPFGRYLESTSAIPFVAAVQGRQRLVLREIPWIALGLGALFALGVRQVHDRIFAWYGAPFIVTVIGGSMLLALITTSRWRRAGVKDLPFPRSDPSLPRDHRLAEGGALKEIPLTHHGDDHGPSDQ
jgi:uncharacterized membrane protein